MNETLNSVLDRMLKAWPYRWQGLAVAAIAAGAATLAILLLPDVYTASAHIAVTLHNDETPVQIHNAEVRLMNDQTLDQALNQLGSDAKSPMARQRARTALRRRIAFDGLDTANFVIRCSDAAPARARDLCNLLLNVFVNAVAESGANANGDTLQQDLAEQLALLSAAERKLEEFRRAHLEVFGQGGIAVRLDTARAALDKARSDYLRAVSLRDQLQASWRAKTDDRSGAASTTVQSNGDPLIDRLYTLYAQLETLRARYSEDHPDVVVARREVETIVLQYPPDIRMCSRDQPKTLSRADWPAPIVALAAMDAGSTPADRPRLDRGTVNVVAANISVCRGEEALSHAETDVRNLAEISASSYPLQQELEQLTHDRDMIKVRVDDIQDRIRSNSGIDVASMYSVIEAPNVPASPSSPDRPLWLMAALAGALASGGLIAYLRGSMAGTFIRGSEVERAFSLPFYGSISQLGSLRNRLGLSTKLASFSIAAAALVAAMLILILADPFIAAGRRWAVGTMDSVKHFAEPSP